MSLQAVLFNKNQYDLNQAKQWLGSHGYHPIKYHITDNYIRARLQEPVPRSPGIGVHYRTGNLAKNIKAIRMVPNRNVRTEDYNNMPRRRRARQVRRRPQRRYGGALDPVDLFANMVLPALMYAGISYGIYRAVKK